MQFWIGRPNFGHRQMLFATQGGRPSEVPHALVHTIHAGLFVRDGRAPEAYFACDRCGLAFRLRVEDGCNPSAAEVGAALDGAGTEEVVSSAASHAPYEVTDDERTLRTYTHRAESNSVAETSRLLAMIEATPMEGVNEDLL